MSDRNQFDDAVADYISQANDGASGVLTGYVIYAEYLDADGDYSWLMAQADGQNVSQSLGQVEALRIYLRKAVEDMLCDDDE